MRARKKRPVAARPSRPRSGRGGQRLKLIDACITALHLYGPSRTTVEKVVAIAKMSPGIVRFYFDSKAAMLVASLQFLAAEFEDRVLVPVMQIKDTPVAALERMVDLYLDSEIASARKVSVWYSFWGEASSRQEYYDICGHKDERFAALVRLLIERLIVDSRQPQLDPDGIALGLIGVLEVLWQGFAFQTEATIDRAAAKRRCMAYVRSIFPRQFAGVGGGTDRAPGRGADAADPAARRSPFDDAALFAAERAALFAGAWHFVGDAAQIPMAADCFAVDLGVERVVILRDAAGTVRAFRNACPIQPHSLVAAAAGRLSGGIRCDLHGLRFGLDGKARQGDGGADLLELPCAVHGDWILVGAGTAAGAPGMPAAGLRTGGARVWAPLRSAGPPQDKAVAADWKLIVEQWLDAALADDAGGPRLGAWDPAEVHASESGVIDWRAQLNATRGGWSAARYLRLLPSPRELAPRQLAWHRRFVPPNQLIETRPDGTSVLQVIPTAAGHSRVRRFDYDPSHWQLPEARAAPALRYLARRLTPCFRADWAALAESNQQGWVTFGYTAIARDPTSRAQRAFRQWYAGRLQLPAGNLYTREPHSGRLTGSDPS
jgi:TetR/AcrR family transcriptional repressor of bet genes